MSSAWSPEHDAVALRMARSAWRSARHADWRGFDYADLQQQARLEGWAWLRGQGDGPVDLGALGNVVGRRLIDWMRTVNRGAGRPGRGREPVRRVSTDMPLPGTTVLLSEVLYDPGAQADLEQVEAAHAVAQAFAQDDGDDGRERLVAFLHYRGVPLDVLGPQMGLTASRASQLRSAFLRRTRRRWAEHPGG